MLVACWSVKGGTGTTVVAAALALVHARRSPLGALVADLTGDIPSALGAAPSNGPGIRDWLAAGSAVPSGALRRLEVDLGAGLRLLPAGDALTTHDPADDLGAARLVTALHEAAVDDSETGAVVVDAGRPDVDALCAAVVAGSSTSLLVLRPCYLGLRRAVASPLRPTGVVLVDEQGRALTAADIEDTLQVPVVATIPDRPEIARAVDAGMLAARLPRALSSALRWAS